MSFSGLLLSSLVKRQLPTVWKCSWRALAHVVSGMRSKFRVFKPAVVLVTPAREGVSITQVAMSVKMKP